MNSSKQDQFAQIRQDLINLTQSPLYVYRQQHQYQVVPGAGDLNAKIMFIGEAPGQKEAETGQPFVGAAGRVLTELLSSINLSREQVFITSILHDRPPNNRDPLPEEISLYAPFLDRLIALIQPHVIATLGRYSLQYIFTKYQLTNHLQTISHLHGQVFDAPETKLKLVPLYHPAVALYRAPMKSSLLKDFQILKNLI